MLKRIVAITVIFICTTIAWFILAGTIWYRTYSFGPKLRSGVVSTWGAPHEQRPPSAWFEKDIPAENEKDKPKRITVALPVESSRVGVNLSLAHRQKGLLWYSTYAVDFTGTYTFRNTGSEPREVTLQFPFPAEQATYDGVAMEVNGRPASFTSDKRGALTKLSLAANETASLRIAYRSQGLETWRYKLGDDIAQSKDFLLTAKTNFKDIDFPPNSLSPTEKRETAFGWELEWRYTNLISGVQISIAMPEKLQPGPLAGEISQFAPVSLFLFFFVLFIVTTLRGIDLHPMNYFFLAAAFFSFHLLLAYLVDHISIHLALFICSVVSVFLVVSYLRLVIGIRFALVEAGLAQLVYLVLFSYTFFLKGFTGLAATIGCIVTLFVVMQLTGRIRWSERFAASLPAPQPRAR